MTWFLRTGKQAADERLSGGTADLSGLELWHCRVKVADRFVGTPTA